MSEPLTRRQLGSLCDALVELRAAKRKLERAADDLARAGLLTGAAAEVDNARLDVEDAIDRVLELTKSVDLAS